jgi:hypothetical protein
MFSMSSLPLEGVVPTPIERGEFGRLPRRCQPREGRDGKLRERSFGTRPRRPSFIGRAFQEERGMAHITYTIVEHDGGWAYKLGDVFSETFPTREAATSAAHRAADEQRVAGQTEAILYEDRDGNWHEELARGDDRPEADVAD